MHIAWIHEQGVWTDGPGLRVSVAVQGCSVRCSGCQVPQTWKHRAGTEMTVQDVAGRLLASGLPVTIMGGEPFDQPTEVAELIRILKDAGRHVIVYSGYVLEDLEQRARERTFEGRAVQGILAHADALVDGPYIQEQDHGRLAYRGSKNQRPIDLEHWRETGEIALLDWETSGDEIRVLPDGTILGPIDVITELEAVLGGTGAPARHCGQAPQTVASEGGVSC